MLQPSRLPTFARRLGRSMLGLALISGMAYAASAAPAFAQAGSGGAHLDTVLHDLDTASARFKTAEAKFRWDFYEAAVHDTSSQSGRIYVERKGGKVEMGALVEQPALQILEYKNAELRIFKPSTNELQPLNAKNNQAKYESFLTLGFGGSGKDLAAAWQINDLGAETLKDGATAVPVEKLELVSKDSGVRDLFSKVTIWIDVQRDVSLKQEFLTGSGDKRTSYYSDVRVNEKLDKGPYAIKTNSKTHVMPTR